MPNRNVRQDVEEAEQAEIASFRESCINGDDPVAAAMSLQTEDYLARKDSPLDGVRAEVWNQDCITGMAEHLEPESVSLVISSPPFEELFQYSGKPQDVGNNGSSLDIRAGRFALNLRFVVDQLFRVLRPGCNAAIHIQQLVAFKIQHGFMGRRDFRGSMIDIFGAGGFQFTGEFAIQKDPQAIAQRLNLHSLQFQTGYARNGCNLMPCVNDYVLIFQKPGEAKHPVKPLWHKTKNPQGWVTTDEWIRDAHGIWTDILEIDVLKNSREKENSQERHVCMLQLEVIRRCVSLYTNHVTIQPDVLVLDPFSGIGSTQWVCLGAPSPVTKLALKEPRNVVGFELKDSYAKIAQANIEKARRTQAAQTLFG